MKVVGARIPRYDGVAHVPGRTTYVDDVRVPGTLWVKALRSPHHHAGITKLDTSKAEAMDGVHAVITWQDVPLLVYGHLSALGIPADEPLLAKDDARYMGQPIALVAAGNEELAAAAVARAPTCAKHSTPVPPRRITRATGTSTSRTRWTVARSARATSSGPSTTPTRSSRASIGPPRWSTALSRRRCARSSPSPVAG